MPEEIWNILLSALHALGEGESARDAERAQKGLDWLMGIDPE